MALKPDQRAMLQLLLERDQSYDDLASVLGVEPGEVRERARAALTELGGSDPDADVGLTDYLLGQADPIGRADAVRHLQSDPESLALAQKIAAQLQLLAPDAELPQLPGSKTKAAKRSPSSDEPAESSATAPRAIPGSGGAAALTAGARTRWDEHRRQTAIILAGVAVLLVILVLWLTGVIGGDDSSSESTTPLLGYPLAPLQVDKQGNVQGELPMEQLGLTILSRSANVDVSLTSNDSLSPAIQTALQQGQPVIDYQGTSILRGSLEKAKTSDNGLTLGLEPVGDSSASGRIAILAKDKKPVMDLDIRGLDPPPANQSYVLWALLPEGTKLPAPSSSTPTAPGTAPPGTGAVPPSAGAAPPATGAVPPSGGVAPPPTGGGGGGGGGGQ